jgi:uncharacterized protein (TIGR02147 family)
MSALFNVYDYSSYRIFLKQYAEEKRKVSPRFSYGAWAKNMNLGGTAVLTNIINGKRNPGPQLSEKFCSYFKFNRSEKEYFLDLIRLQKTSKDSRLSVFLMEKLANLHPNKDFKLLDIKTFKAISKWYSYAIREMVNLKDFREDPDWISKKLNFKVKPKQIKEAIRDLIELDLLKRDFSGCLKFGTDRIHTTNDISSEGLKRFHEEMIENAKESIRSIDVVDRNITGITFGINKKDLPDAKKMINEFQKQFAMIFEKIPSESTYQFNMQFFPLTNNYTQNIKNTKDLTNEI